MISPAAIVILLNGAIVPSAPPARLVAGHVMVPVAPVVTRFTDRAAVDGTTVTLVRGTHACSLNVGVATYVCDGVTLRASLPPFAVDRTAFVALADVAAAFGATVAYDARAHTASIDIAPDTALHSPAPFDPLAPQAAPTQIFTPTPGPATPRPIVSDDPRPRRTAIPVAPSRTPD